MRLFICRTKKSDANELIYKTERDSQTENEFMVIGGKGGGDRLGVWD